MQNTLSTKQSERDTMVAEREYEWTASHILGVDLETLERQLIATLNGIRKMQNKRPVILPKS